jgi:branched-chain amino acid transport system permease protein
MSEFLASYANLIDLVLLNSLIGYSVWLVLNGNMFSMATGGFLSIGAYTSVFLTMTQGVTFPFAAAAGAGAAGLAAALLGTPLMRLKGDYFALATLAFTEVVRVIALNWESVTGGALGIYGIPRLTQTSYLLGALAAAIFFAWALKRSHFGRAIAAVRADEVPASAMGVNVFSYRLGLFVASGAICGVAGALAGHLNFFIAPNDFGLSRTIDAIAYPILGGIGSTAGPVIGAAAYTVLPEVLRFSNQLREILAGGLLLAAILFLPNGLASIRLRGFHLPFLLNRKNEAAAGDAKS